MRVYIVGATLGLIVFAAALLLLSYLNILPLADLFPSKLQERLTVSQPGGPLLLCPLESAPCPLGETNLTSSQTPNFLGLGYVSVAAGTKVKASLAGEVKISAVKKEGKGDRTLLTISDSKRNLLITYRFRGEAAPGPEPRNVGLGEVLGFLSDDVIGENQFGKGYNLVISLQDLTTQQYLPLTSTQKGISFKERP